MRPTPASRARASSSSDLLLPCMTRRAGRHAGRQGHVQLAAGGDVEPHPLLVGQPGHGRAQEGLGGVGHAVAPGRHGLAAAGPQMRPRRRRTAASRTARPARPGRRRRRRDGRRPPAGPSWGAARCRALVGRAPGDVACAETRHAQGPVAGARRSDGTGLRRRPRHVGATSTPGRSPRAGRDRWRAPRAPPRRATGGPG